MSVEIVQLAESESPFTKVTQESVRMLESITPAEKGQSVPYLKIWQINPFTGKPVHMDQAELPKNPLSIKLVQPPTFGMPVNSTGFEMRERPPVSLQKIVINTQCPRGLIMYRKLSMSFVVHRPDVIFQETQDDADTWSSLISPGTVFGMKYGWTASAGVKNGLLNGEGIEDNSVLIPAMKEIRFQVTNYNFTINADMEFEFSIEALESGDLHVRRTIIDMREDDKAQARQKGNEVDKNLAKTTDIVDPYTEDGKQILKSVQDKIKSLQKDDGYDKGSKGIPATIKFESIVRVLFADSLEKAYSNAGFRGKIKILIGSFNSRAGFTSPAYGHEDQSGHSIGDFKFPYKEIEQEFIRITKAGQELTVFNFMKPFLAKFNTPAIWDNSKKSNSKIPEVILKTMSNKGNVNIYFFDVKEELIKFDSKEEENTLRSTAKTRADIKKELDNKIPMVSLLKANSYIQDAKFSVQSDDKLKSIFIRRYFGDQQTKKDVTSKTDISKKMNTAVPPIEVLYSSAIQGDLTMIGNFVFDTFGLIWLDFGVPRFSGPFFVMSKEDVIERGNFSTKIHVYAAGTDPLGTQGRYKATGVTK